MSQQNDAGSRKTSEALLKLRALKKQFSARSNGGDGGKKQVWFKNFDADGTSYYFCRDLGKSQWTKPEGDNVVIQTYKRKSTAKLKVETKPRKKPESELADLGAYIDEEVSDVDLSDASVLSDVWYENEDPVRGIYYFNRARNISQWKHPGKDAIVRKFMAETSDEESSSEPDDSPTATQSSRSLSPRRRTMGGHRKSLPHPDFHRAKADTGSNDAANEPSGRRPTGSKYKLHVDLSGNDVGIDDTPAEMGMIATPKASKSNVDASDDEVGVDDQPAEMEMIATPKASINHKRAKAESAESIRKSGTWPLQQIAKTVEPAVHETLWYRHKDKTGQTYFFNRVTRQSVWEEPKGAGVKVLDYKRSQANRWRTAAAAVVATSKTKQKRRDSVKDVIREAEEEANEGNEVTPRAEALRRQEEARKALLEAGEPNLVPRTPRGSPAVGGPGSPAAMPATPKRDVGNRQGVKRLTMPRESFPPVGEDHEAAMNSDDSEPDEPASQNSLGMPPLNVGPGSSKLQGKIKTPAMKGAPPLTVDPGVSGAVARMPGAPPLAQSFPSLDTDHSPRSDNVDTPETPASPVRSKPAVTRAASHHKSESVADAVFDAMQLTDDEESTETNSGDSDYSTQARDISAESLQSPSRSDDLSDKDRVRNMIMARALGASPAKPLPETSGEDHAASSGSESDDTVVEGDETMLSPGDSGPSSVSSPGGPPLNGVSPGGPPLNSIMSPGGPPLHSLSPGAPPLHSTSPTDALDALPLDTGGAAHNVSDSDNEPAGAEEGLELDLQGDTPFLQGRRDGDGPTNLADAPALEDSLDDDGVHEDADGDLSGDAALSMDTVAAIKAAQSAGAPPLKVSPVSLQRSISLSSSDDETDEEEVDELDDELSPMAATRSMPRKVSPETNKRMSIVALKKRRTKSVKEDMQRVGNKAMHATTDAQLKRARMLTTKVRACSVTSPVVHVARTIHDDGSGSACFCVSASSPRTVLSCNKRVRGGYSPYDCSLVPSCVALPHHAETLSWPAEKEGHFRGKVVISNRIRPCSS